MRELIEPKIEATPALACCAFSFRSMLASVLTIACSLLSAVSQADAGVIVAIDSMSCAYDDSASASLLGSDFSVQFGEDAPLSRAFDPSADQGLPSSGDAGGQSVGAPPAMLCQVAPGTSLSVIGKRVAERLDSAPAEPVFERLRPPRAS